MLYADTMELTKRNSSQELFFLTIESVPEKNNPAYYENGYDGDAEELVGAYVNCYINADSLQKAEQTAIHHIAESGWRPVALRRWNLLDSQEYQESNHPEWKEEHAYVMGAFSAGAAYVYYTFEASEGVDDGETDEWIRFTYHTDIKTLCS